MAEENSTTNRAEPNQKLFMNLAKEIGTDHMKLGINLNMQANDVRTMAIDNNNKAFDINFAVLEQWSNNEEEEDPDVRYDILCEALSSINRKDLEKVARKQQRIDNNGESRPTKVKVEDEQVLPGQPTAPVKPAAPTQVTHQTISPPQPYWPAQPAQPAAVTVVRTAPVMTVHYGQSPVQTTCHSCQQLIVTRTSHTVGGQAIIWCVGLVCVGCVGGCCLIPCAMDSCKDVSHECPNCGAQLGEWTR